MPLAVTVTLDTFAADQLLEGAAARSLDLRPVWADVVEPTVTEFFEEQFATEGRAGGTPWAPLTPATLAAKARAGREGMGILRFTNALWGSFVNAGSAGSIRVMEPQRYVRGSSLTTPSGRGLAALHQSGWIATQWGGRPFHAARDVPPRPIVPDPLPQAWVLTWGDAVAKYI